MPSISAWQTNLAVTSARVTLPADDSSTVPTTWVSVVPLTIVVTPGTKRILATIKGRVVTNGVGGVAMRVKLIDITGGGSVDVANTETPVCSANSDTTTYAATGEGTSTIDLVTSTLIDRTYRVQVQKIVTGGTPSTALNMTTLAGSSIEYKTEFA